MTGVGCCDTDGTNYYCNQGGTLASDACGGVDPTDGGDTAADGGTTGDTSDTGGTDTGGTDTGGTTGGDPDEGVYAANLQVGKVEVTQGVAITLGNGSSTVSPNSRNARVVQGREALFRAGWTTLSGFSSHAIEGRLVIDGPGGTQVYTDTRTVSGSANFNSYDGTFRWVVDAEDMAPGATYSIAFYEPGQSGGSQPATTPRHPASGMADLGVPNQAMELDVVLVPVRWQYGGQDRTPNLNASNIETIRQRIYEHNPVNKVNISVRSQPALYQSAINLNNVLNLISQTRSNDSPANSVYYEGLVDFGCAYISGSSCSQYGGTTGVGYVAGTNSYSANQRASISVFYNVDSSADTLTHELGHNQGLDHAPCGGVSGADGNFPYSGGGIGVQGWIIGTTNLLSASSYKDYMGYCSPSWVADWTWEKTATRIATLTGSSYVEPEGLMLQGLIDAEGNESWVVVRGSVPEDEIDPEIRVRFRSAGGLVAEAGAVESWLSDADTRVLLVQLPDELGGSLPLAGIDNVQRLEPNGELVELDMLSIMR